MNDMPAIWIDGTPYSWETVVSMVRASVKRDKEPKVEEYAQTMQTRYNIRWEDGETWFISVYEDRVSTEYFVYDPNERQLRVEDPMYQELVDVIKRHHKTTIKPKGN